MTTMFYVNAIAVACNLPVLATTSLPEPEVCNDNPSIDIAQFDRADQMCEVIRQQVASKSKTVVGRQGRAVAGRPADPVCEKRQHVLSIDTPSQGRVLPS